MLKELCGDFISLFFPSLCTACKSALVKQERLICINCLYNLPKTNFHLDENNTMARLFWGRVKIESAAAFYYFEKGSKCKKILHQVKYKGEKELALLIGKIYGRELFISGHFSDPEILIPVPLHYSREKTRGFNQSEWFARGLAHSLGKKVFNDTLIRFVDTKTQTNKSRTERWENVENSFMVQSPEKIINKHILLVDDVVTTGATLESCALSLIQYKKVRISILTMAYA